MGQSLFLSDNEADSDDEKEATPVQVAAATTCNPACSNWQTCTAGKCEDKPCDPLCSTGEKCTEGKCIANGAAGGANNAAGNEAIPSSSTANAPPMKTSKARVCNPWSEIDCPHAGDTLTCKEYHDCRKLAGPGLTPCAGTKEFSSCGWNYDDGTGNKLVANAPQAAPSSSTANAPPPMKTSKARMCNPWSEVDCPRAGDTLTCKEYHDCRTKAGRAPCAGTKEFTSCGWNYDNGTGNKLVVDAPQAAPSSSTANAPVATPAADWKKFYDYTPNRAIKGHNDEKLTGKTLNQCLEACQNNDKCQGVDWYKKKDKCDLSYTHSSTTGLKKYPKNPYDHYAKKQSQVARPTTPTEPKDEFADYARGRY